MNTTLIRKWADALDSHRYVQGYGFYFGSTKVRACALGVLLIELHEDPDDSLVLCTTATGRYSGTWADGERRSIASALSMRDIPRDITGDVVEMNDIDRMSFAEIAQWLRVKASQADAATETGLPS